MFNFRKEFSAQLTAIYLAPDHSNKKLNQWFSVDLESKKNYSKGKGELFINATDVLNTMITRKEIIKAKDLIILVMIITKLK
jgi:hypothetical protein